MNGMLSPEQVQFADAVARFSAREYGAGTARPRHVFSRERHVRLAGLGCLALAVPEAAGGFGGPVEIMLAAERLAPALAQEPFIGTGVFAASLIAGAGAPTQAEALLARIGSGEALVAVAHHEKGSGYAVDAIGMRAAPVDGGWQLSGAKTLVDCAQHADGFVVSARDTGSGELLLLLVDRNTQGLEISVTPRLDGLPSGDVVLEGCDVGAAARLAVRPAQEALAEAIDRTQAAEVAAMTGVMDACIQATIDYLRARRQFGAPIGAFQALQHRVADMWIACEETRSLAFAAAHACNGPAHERRRAVSMAKVRACDAAQLIGAETIQLHGGIGMTDELIVGHWYKRLLALRLSLGDRRHHVARLASSASNWTGTTTDYTVGG